MQPSGITQVLQTMHIQTNDTLLKKSWLNFGEKNEYRLSIANDRASKESAYKLVYKTYIEKEYAQYHSSKMWFSIYDAHPETITFIVKKDIKVVGALTVVFDSKLGLPCYDLFQKDVELLRSEKDHLAEVISLAVDQKERGATEVLSKLFNTVIRFSQRIKGATDFLITTNPRHSSFYKKRLLFTEINKANAYKKVGGAPAVLLQLNLNETQNIIKNKHHKKYKRTLYPNFISFDKELDIFEKLMFEQKEINEVDFNYFFKNHRNIYHQISLEKQQYLTAFYPFLKTSQHLQKVLA